MRRTRLLTLVLACAAPVAGARADDSDALPSLSRSHWQGLERGRREASTDEEPVRRAIGSGLAFLARQQVLTGDGSLTLGEEADHDSPVGVTALAALAWMAAGSGPTRGPHQQQVSKAIDYLLSHQAAEGQELEGYISDARDRQSRTHGHGLATLALAESYSMSPQSTRGRRTARALALAVRRIEVCQSQEGGWFYDPRRSVEHEGSVTVCLVQGLRAARNVGVQVDVQVIDKAIEYVKGLQTGGGGFQYSPTQPETSVALTAACLSTLHAMGIYDGPVVKNGYDYVWRELAARELDLEAGKYGSQARFPYYERFYLAQALWQHPDQGVFRVWAEKETRRVLASQREDGSWVDRRYFTDGSKLEGRYGSAYATAMNCLVLSVPDGLLPIFQR